MQFLAWYIVTGHPYRTIIPLILKGRELMLEEGFFLNDPATDNITRGHIIHTADMLICPN